MKKSKLSLIYLESHSPTLLSMVLPIVKKPNLLPSMAWALRSDLSRIYLRLTFVVRWISIAKLYSVDLDPHYLGICCLGIVLCYEGVRFTSLLSMLLLLEIAFFYWKVRNCGEAAFQRNCIRGEIQRGNKDGFHDEKTDFVGPHYVECYAVRSGVCIARSRIEVPIS